jgi:hypothetical protein
MLAVGAVLGLWAVPSAEAGSRVYVSFGFGAGRCAPYYGYGPVYYSPVYYQPYYPAYYYPRSYYWGPKHYYGRDCRYRHHKGHRW